MPNRTNTLDTIKFLNYILTYSYYSFNLTDQLKLIASYNIDDMLINCRYNDIPCTKNDFEYFFTLTYGNCYKFNSGKNFTGDLVKKRATTTPGFNNGLRLELFVGHSNLEYELIRSSGVRLFIHNSSNIPLTVVEGLVYLLALRQIL